MLQGCFLARDHFLRMKSICEATFPRFVCDEMAIMFLVTCSQEAGWMLGHTLGFYHPQHLVLPAMPHPTMHFPVSSACTAYMAIPISTWDQKFESWDPGSHSTQLIKKQVLNLITRALRGAYTDRTATTCWPTISFTIMILSETPCTSKPFPIHSSTPEPLSFPDQQSLYLVSLPFIVH